MSARDELAAAIAPVLVSTNPNQVQAFDDLPQQGQLRWLSRATAVADEILARYAVVELPAPDEDNGIDPPNWFDGGFVEAEGGLVYIGEEIGSSRSDPAAVRILAAALLAAANRAETQS